MLPINNYVGFIPRQTSGLVWCPTEKIETSLGYKQYCFVIGYQMASLLPPKYRDRVSYPDSDTIRVCLTMWR